MKCAKIIIWCCTFIIISCSEPEVIVPTEKIFQLSESRVTNGQFIYFDLPSKGTYTLTLIDKESGQVISREKFIGKSGKNIRSIYTKSLQNTYLYLLLEDVTKKELGKTLIIIK